MSFKWNAPALVLDASNYCKVKAALREAISAIQIHRHQQHSHEATRDSLKCELVRTHSKLAGPYEPKEELTEGCYLVIDGMIAVQAVLHSSVCESCLPLAQGVLYYTIFWWRTSRKVSLVISSKSLPSKNNGSQTALEQYMYVENSTQISDASSTTCL